MVVPVSHQKGRNARREITNCCRSACSRCNKAQENCRPNSDRERSECPNAGRMTVRLNECVNSANDCIDGNNKPQKYQADAWPPLWEAGNEPLQRIPPRGTDTPQKEASFFRRGLDPQIECFLCTTCRFFGYSEVTSTKKVRA